MTKEEILAMEAGRELDALIATEIMRYQGVGFYRRKSRFTSGWEPCAIGDVTPDTPEWKAQLAIWREDGEVFAVKLYSTDILYAWQVVEKVREWGCHVDVDCLLREIHCQIWYPTKEYPKLVWESPWVVVVSQEAPIAICKAALLAKLEILNEG